MTTKICRTCGTEKPLSEYHKERGRYRNACKQCRNAYRKRIYDENIEEERRVRRERNNARYHDDPEYREGKIAYAKQYAEEHHDTVLANKRDYWHNKVDKDVYKKRRNKRRKQRYRTDPEFRNRRNADGRISARKRKLRMKNVRGSHTEDEWKELLEKYNHLCLCCGSAENITRDQDRKSVV